MGQYNEKKEKKEVEKDQQLWIKDNTFKNVENAVLLCEKHKITKTNEINLRYVGNDNATTIILFERYAEEEYMERLNDYYLISVWDDTDLKQLYKFNCNDGNADKIFDHTLQVYIKLSQMSLQELTSFNKNYELVKEEYWELRNKKQLKKEGLEEWL